MLSFLSRTKLPLVRELESPAADDPSSAGELGSNPPGFPHLSYSGALRGFLDPYLLKCFKVVIYGHRLEVLAEEMNAAGVSVKLCRKFCPTQISLDGRCGRSVAVLHVVTALPATTCIEWFSGVSDVLPVAGLYVIMSKKSVACVEILDIFGELCGWDRTFASDPEGLLSVIVMRKGPESDVLLRKHIRELRIASHEAADVEPE